MASNLGLPPFDQPRANVNGDDIVDVCDLALVAQNLGRIVPLPLRAMRVEQVFPDLSFQRLTSFVQPDGEPAEDKIFITEQPGRIRISPKNEQAAQSDVFLDLTSRVSEASNEEGLLSLAFDPDYEDKGYLYVYYSAAGPRGSVLSRFSATEGDPNVADPDSEFIIMEIPQPFPNHNGGQIAFGPDGYLYVGLGDGGSGGDPLGNGRNKGTLLGSILRIDVGGVSGGENYRIPADNPFVGDAAARGEIWAYGLRNPWRFSFDESTGLLWLGDVGQNAWEEVDIIRKGLNYGWNVMEGLHCFKTSYRLRPVRPRGALVRVLPLRWELLGDGRICLPRP